MTVPAPHFVHLRTHSDYSIFKGLPKVARLVERAAELRMPALALSDCGNLHGLVKFHTACMKHGVKPLVAVDFRVRVAPNSDEYCSLLLIARDQAGYANLSRLVTRSYAEPHRGIPLLDESWLPHHCAGLIALSGGSSGKIGAALREGNPTQARNCLQEYQRWFPRAFYLEIQRTEKEGEEECLRSTLELAKAQDVPIVATNDVCFLQAEEFEAHEVRVCIHDGLKVGDPERPRLYTRHQYLKSSEEMVELFRDIPAALINSAEIARRCNFGLDSGRVRLPQFLDGGAKAEAELLEREATQGLVSLLEKNFPDTRVRENRKPEYNERLSFELGVITEMGYSGYFLIVMEFIRWARKQGIPVGPGRGSGAGSLVSHALGITSIDPLKYDLFFERFLNPERVSLPDIDIDFCVENRDRVIQHVVDRYGKDAVSHIITFGVMAAKAVVRDVARVQDKPYAAGDRLARLIPFGPGVSLDSALEDETLRNLVQQDHDAGEIMDMARKLEGVIRNVGKHAGGIVIAPGKLVDHIPLTSDDNGVVMTQFDKDDIEHLGLVKFDFLGLRTLTIIHHTVLMLNERRRAAGEPSMVLDELPLDDVGAYDLLKTGHSVALFQLESEGMKALLRRLQPDCFEDMVALMALYRPGPLRSGMLDDFINRKHGQARVEYPHPRLEPVLKNTYGVILYQEQVMQIGQILAGYSLGDADLLRRAMGKKKADEMAGQRKTFIDNACARGLERERARRIFELMEKFAGYGFNKAHSVAYALVAYQTLWFKCHHPAEYMAAVMSADMQDTERLRILVAECRRMKLTLKPPDVNRNANRFTIDEQGCILYGLGAIKGLGAKVVDTIISNRGTGYKDLFDFATRAGQQVVNRRVLETLVQSGAFDALPNALRDSGGEPHRAAMFAGIDDLLNSASQSERKQRDGMADLFGESSALSAIPDINSRLLAITPWTIRERLSGEMKALGLYFSGHPLQEYQEEVSIVSPRRAAQLGGLEDGSMVTLMGLVTRVQKKRAARSGEMLAFITLDDGSGTVDLMLPGEVFMKYQKHLRMNAVLTARGIVGARENGKRRVNVQVIHSIPETRGRFTGGLRLGISSTNCDGELLERLARLLERHRGDDCMVTLVYQSAAGEAVITPSRKWRVCPEDILLESLRKMLGADRVTLMPRMPSLSHGGYPA